MTADRIASLEAEVSRLKMLQQTAWGLVGKPAPSGKASAPETLTHRLRGVYPSAVSSYKTSPLHHEAADEIDRMRKELNEAYDFRPGDHVEKHTGDYKLEGIVVSAFKTIDGKPRYVVEHRPLAPGMLHIYGPTNLRKVEG